MLGPRKPLKRKFIQPRPEIQVGGAPRQSGSADPRRPQLPSHMRHLGGEGVLRFRVRGADVERMQKRPTKAFRRSRAQRRSFGGIGVGDACMYVMYCTALQHSAMECNVM